MISRFVSSVPSLPKSKELSQFCNIIENGVIVSRRFAGGLDTPFPMNPQFKPKPPLSDTTRTAIFKLYQTKKSTPRELADEFGISLVRTEAILRLKALQQTLPQSLMQSDFSLKMDQALASETITPSKTRREPLRQPTLNPIAPFLQFLNEEDSFTPADAAHLLLREPFANITRKLNIKASSIFHVSEPVSESNQPLDDEIISKDDFQTSKNNLMFVDTSTSKMLVRESNGVLRNANKVERWNKKYSKVANFKMY